MAHPGSSPPCILPHTQLACTMVNTSTVFTLLTALLFSAHVDALALKRGGPRFDIASVAQIAVSDNGTSHYLDKRAASTTPLWYPGQVDPWAKFTAFSWTPFINWGFTGHSLGYVKLVVDEI